MRYSCASWDSTAYNMTTVHHVYCNSLMVQASIVYQFISVSHVAQTNHKLLRRSGRTSTMEIRA